MRRESRVPGESARSSPLSDRPRTGSSTRRRLVFAFSVVLAAFVSALSFQNAGLHRMEATFDAMERHEDIEQLALQLEDAVRAQYATGENLYAPGRFDPADYGAARARVVELAQKLRARVSEPEPLAWVDEIIEVSARLDRRVRARTERAALDTSADEAPPERLVFRIEHNVDRLFARLHKETSSFRRDLVRLQQSSERWSAGLIAAAPFLVAAVALYLSRSVARPLARLQEGAAAIASGRLDTRIQIASRDEFGALAAEFNAMTIALEKHQAQLVQAEKLASVGRLAAGVAHEINNPLQVMLGYLSLNRSVPDPNLREQLAAIEHEAQRCKGIVEDLLDLSRPALVRARVDLRDVCDDVVQGLRVAMNGSTAELSVDGYAWALGDEGKLRQVVLNLVKNALEASGPPGSVAISLRTSDGRVKVDVIDDGPGVTTEARRRLFEPFFSTKKSGKGLGLAVSRAIARAHGGDIEVGNRSPRGAVFTLELPSVPLRGS